MTRKRVKNHFRTEASETLLCFVAMCLWPQHFATLALVFAALCGLTTLTRVVGGWRVLQSPASGPAG